MNSTNTIICGAGIAGVACAYYLSRENPQSNIVVVDKLMPLSLTTAMSGENFRAYWPQPWMHDFVSHSIDLMEELQRQHPDKFTLNFSGYDFVSHLQRHTIFPTDSLRQRDDFTIVDNPAQIQSQKPYLDASIQQVLQVNRAGALDVYALGSLMLDLARAQGVKFIKGEISGIERVADGYQIELGDRQLDASNLVLCAGPFTPTLAKYLDIELPVYSVLQRKFVIPDPLHVIPRDMPFTIYADPQKLDWSDNEREQIEGDPQFSYLLREFPAGLHIKPESHSQIKLGWAFNRELESPQWEPASSDEFASIVMRGATRFIPGLKNYLHSIPTPVVEFAGYYTRTAENLPLIGMLDDHLFTVSALAGYGTMAACAAGQLCSAYMNSSKLPDYAAYLAPQRYQDHTIMKQVQSIPMDGQL